MRQFQALAAFRHTVSTVASYWRVGLRIAVPWMAVLAAVSYFAGAPSVDTSGQPQYRAIDLVILVVSFAAMASIAVSWHRFILKDEVPGKSDLFRIDSRVVRYLLNMLGVVLGTGLVAAVLIIILLQLLHPVIAAAIILLPMLTLVQIAMLGLPAIAIDAEKPGLTKSFELTRADIGQIAVFTILNTGFSIAVILPLSLLEFALSQLSEPVARVISALASIPVTSILILISIGGFTSLYGYFVEGRNFKE
jgi:hypothetical protein